MSARRVATHTKTNGMLQIGDWIWIRGQEVRVVVPPEECTAAQYVSVVVRNRRGGQWAETMLRARRRKVA